MNNTKIITFVAALSWLFWLRVPYEQFPVAWAIDIAAVLSLAWIISGLGRESFTGQVPRQPSRGTPRSLIGAVEDWNQTLQLDANSAAAYTNRGDARYVLGDFEGALEDYTQALRINPSLATAHVKRGAARGEMGDMQGALEDYNLALKLNPSYSVAYVRRGAARLELGDVQGAMEDYDRALKLKPQDAAARIHRGTIHAGIGMQAVSSTPV